MTFGEHLEELRSSLVKAIIWLGVGLCVGLFFANDVIRFIQTPLQNAIQQFNADRDLTNLGYSDLNDPEIQPLREFLMQNALVWETIYEIPEELQTLAPDAIESNLDAANGADVPAVTVKPYAMKELL